MFNSLSRKIPHAMEQQSPCTKTIESVLESLGAACASRAHAPQDKPLQRDAHSLQLDSSRWSPQTEKSPCSSEDPAQPKINKQIFKKETISRLSFSCL